MNRQALSFILWITLLSSCEPPEKKLETSTYFNVASYFASEAVLLQNKQPSLKKAVTLNGITENIHPYNISNWEKELEVFAQSDINRSAWIGKYSMDTMPGKDEFILTHRTLDPSLKIKEIQVHIPVSGLANQIKIKLSEKNLLFESKQELHYHRAQFMSLKGFQKIRWMPADSFQVYYQFLPETTISE